MASIIARGIDVSEHQGSIDWAIVKNQIDFAILRCGYGKDIASQDDKYWITNKNACEEYGIPYGVYLYSYATSVTAAKSEAEHVLRLIKGCNLSYPVFYDMEDESQSGLGRSLLAQIAEAFLTTIEDAGYYVGVYANTNWFSNYLTASIFDNYDKWLAQYASSVTYDGEYTIWQYSSSGTVDGISGRVDMNYSYKDYPSIINPPTPIVPPEPEPEPAPEYLDGHFNESVREYKEFQTDQYSFTNHGLNPSAYAYMYKDDIDQAHMPAGHIFTNYSGGNNMFN